MTSASEMNSPFAWLTLLVLVFAQNVQEVVSLSDAQERKINSVVNAAIKCWNVPGLSLAAVQGGKTVMARGYGKADIENDTPVTDKTLFSAASISKQFTATLLGIFLEDNGIGWKTKVRDIMADFVMPSDYMTIHTTLEDVIAHRTGLAENINFGQFSGEEAFERYRLSKSQVGFREEFVYNSMMFSVAGLVSAKLGGKSWDVLMKERLFNPLSMHSATFLTPSLLNSTNLVANPYKEKTTGGELVPIDPYANAYLRAVAPAGGIAVSARCMAKYMEFLTNGGTNKHGKQLLSPKAFKEMFQPLMNLPLDLFGGMFQLPVTPYPLTLDAYARGWVLGYYRGERSVFHFGDLYGFHGLITTFLELQIGVYTNTNGPSQRRGQLANLLIHSYVTDILMGKEPWLNETSICSYRDYVKDEPTTPPPPPPAHIDKNLPASRPLSEYTGTYGDLSIGNFTVLINDSTMKLQIEIPPMFYGSLFATKVDDQFAVEVFGPLSSSFDLSTKYNPKALVTFSPNKNGVIDLVDVSMYNLTLQRGLKFEPDKIPLRKDCQA